METHNDPTEIRNKIKKKIYLVPLEVSEAENRSRNFIGVSSCSVINWGLAPEWGRNKFLLF